MNFRALFRLFTAGCFTAYFIFSNSAGAAPAKIDKQQVRGVVKTFLETTKTQEQVLGNLSLAGVSAELRNEIRAASQTGAQKNVNAPKVTLENDHILVDGKATGVSITSYSPLNVEYNGKVWNYDRHKTADENYVSLNRLFQDKNS